MNRSNSGFSTRLLRLVVAGLLAFTLAACGSDDPVVDSDGTGNGDTENNGGGDSGGGETDGDGETGPGREALAEIQFLIDHMKETYYWADQLPAQITATDYTDALDALEQLKDPEDRFSTIANAQRVGDFYAGKLTAFGFLYIFEDDNMRVRFVHKNSPAYAAGLRRGDLITRVNGKSPGQWNAEGQLGEAFGPREVGIERQFVVQTSTGEQRIWSIKKTQFDIEYVQDYSVIEQGERKIGYISFYSFSDLGIAPWNRAIDELVAQGVDDLIVDLRLNGGGLISVGTYIGAQLGSGSLQNQLMGTTSHNRQNVDKNFSYFFRDHPLAGSFDNLVWLTSGSTCSSSEFLINGLAPYRSSTRIGGKTCGKPFGFQPKILGDKRFSIVNFRMVNAAGNGDYADGLLPDCPVSDDNTGKLGSGDDSLTSAALSFLATGNCPGVPVHSHVLKSGDPNEQLRHEARKSQSNEF